MSVLDANIILEKGKFTTFVYRKSTFSRICTHFDSFLTPINKIGFLHALSYRWTKFHLELVKLIDVFKSNSYPENFINNCFKVFLVNEYRIHEKVITVPKKHLFLVLPHLGPLPLQTRNKLKKSLKGILNCCKLEIVFKHRHKKRKESLETRGELAVLRTYVENQAILEPILLYWGSKFKQIKEQGSKNCLWTHSLPFYKIIVSFFFFFLSKCKQNKIRQDLP